MSVLCLLFSVFCFLWLSFVPASAQEKAVAASEFPFAEEEALFWGEEEKIISATRYIKRLREAPAIATVITAKQIRNMGARNLMDILKIVPGIGISMITGYGKYGIESRGIKSIDTEKALIMIDGHRVNETLSGGAMWVFDDLMVENIKRVEVIRGPGSALYGANAFVAVINIVTKNMDDIDGINIRAGGGNFGTQHYNLQVGKEFSGLKIAGTIDYLDINGARLNVASDRIGRSGQTDDWKEKYDLGLKMSYKDFSFNGRYVNKNRGPYIGILNALNDESRIETSYLFGELIFKKSFTEDLHFLMKGYYDDWHYYAFWEGFPEGVLPGFPDGMIGAPEAKNRTLGLEIQLDYSLGDKHAVTGGAVYEKTNQYDVRYTVNFNPNTNAPLGSLQDVTSWGNWNQNKDRSITALYLQDVWKIMPDIEGTFGIRYDHYSDFGDTVNPRAGLVWNFFKDAHLKLLYGSAFRAPNFKELYITNNPVQLGNPNIKPEKIKTYEASIGYRFSKIFSGNVTYFHNDIEDIIGLQSGQYQNLGEAKVDGVEAELKANYKNSNYGYINYTFQYPRDSDTGMRIEDVPSHKGNIGANIGLNKYVNANANLLVVGPRPRSSTDSRGKLAGYEVLDLSLIFKNFYKTAEIRGSIYNLLDENYADPDSLAQVQNDFPRQGISFILEAGYRF